MGDGRWKLQIAIELEKYWSIRKIDALDHSDKRVPKIYPQPHWTYPEFDGLKCMTTNLRIFTWLEETACIGITNYDLHQCLMATQEY